MTLENILVWSENGAEEVDHMLISMPKVNSQISNDGEGHASTKSARGPSVPMIGEERHDFMGKEVALTLNVVKSKKTGGCAEFDEKVGAVIPNFEILTVTKDVGQVGWVRSVEETVIDKQNI